MKTLIIHPYDITTAFLSQIYQNLDNKTVVSRDRSKKRIKKLIEIHDRVIMMGHGSPEGLFSVGRFPSRNGFVIDKDFIDVLKEKDNNIFIWCHASNFVERYNLKGFSTGMFISELYEAYYCGLPFSKIDSVSESNEVFTKILTESIELSTPEIYENVLTNYGELSKKNDVANYNYNLLKYY
jgi:hypothetical protein